ncbi:MAG: glycosyltransferase family 2 protein [Candidatus Aenigmarchaeota archaeon]|nr:glycosyltransferase family 2 protein [Candidatus Aenigmarchaeota archaeon]
MKKVSIIIPAYNEEGSISGIVSKARKYGNVIVVNDCSSDNTAAQAKKAGALVVSHKANRGLGGALRTGFAKALSMKADIVITMDADGQHLPENIPRFLEKINGGYDFVLGERNLTKYPFVKRFGNFFLNAATNFISGTSVKDTESGFRAFRSDALRKLFLKSHRYEIAVEIIFEVGRNRLKSCNVPVSSPLYIRGVGMMDGIRNFLFLMHRRDRRWRDYIQDAKYVLRKWL